MVSLVLKRTKNENFTNLIMSYVVDTTYNDYIKNTAHFEYLHELQLFELAGYTSYSNMSINIQPVLDNKERMFNVHSFLINHPINNQITLSTYICGNLEHNKDYCLNKFNDYWHIYETSILKMIRFWSYFERN